MVGLRVVVVLVGLFVDGRGRRVGCTARGRVGKGERDGFYLLVAGGVIGRWEKIG